MKEELGGYCAESGAIVMKEGEGCKLRRKRGKGSESGARVQKAAQLSNRQGRGVTSLSWHRQQRSTARLRVC